MKRAQRHVPPARAARRTPRRARGDRDPRARQGARRRPRRGRPRPRERRVRLRCRRTCSRARISTEVSSGIDVQTVLEPLGVVAGITPFNFPVMVPLWMISNAIACGNSFVLKPSEKDPSASLLLAELAHEAGLPRRRAQRRPGRRRSGRTRCSLTPTSSRCRSSGARRSRVTCTRRPRSTASACRRSAARRTTWSCCPTPTSTPPPTPRSRPGYGVGGRALHGDLGRRGGRSDRRRARRRHRRANPSVTVGPGDDPASMMGPLITAEHRDRVRSYVDGAASEGARVVVDGSDAAARRRLLPRLLARRRRQARHAGVRRRDLRPGARASPACRPSTTRSTSSTPTPYGNGVALYTRDGAAARRFQRRCRSAWSASTCRSRCPWRRTRSAAGRRRSSATTRSTAPRACASTRDRR